MRRPLMLAVLLATLAASPSIADLKEPRLGFDVRPTFEAIRLKLDADQSDYTGSARIELAIAKPVTSFRFHGRPRLTRATLTQNGQVLTLKTDTLAFFQVQATAPAPLAVGVAVLELEFASPYDTRAVGLYRVKKGVRSYLFTQFEAVDARGAFPCWDEPCFKIPYQLTLEVPTKHAALTNTPIESESTQGTWKTIVFKRTPPLPSYLLALATGPFEFTDVPGLAVPARIVTVQGQKQLTGLGVEMTPKLMKSLEDYFGRPYPYEKLDLLAVPDYWYGAMENPGAITFSDNVLLVDPKASSAQQRRNLARIIAHELAHMWFGDLVTMTWWDDLWLNESFADWMGDKVTDRVYPQFQHLLAEQPRIEDVKNLDARTSTRAIQQTVDDPSTGLNNVGVAYNKGKAVLGMFETWLGPETFRRGIQSYLKEHEWKNAVSADLWRALAKASGRDVERSMGTFIEQSGLPRVRVEPLAGARVRVSQQRFLNFGTQAPDRAWQVPMTLRYSDGTTVREHRMLLGPQAVTVKLPGVTKLAWVMPNGGGAGYYRWSMPTDAMLQLNQHASELAPRERMDLVGNLAALLDAGEVHGDAYLGSITTFANDLEPLVVSAALGGLGRARLAFVTPEVEDAFAAYVRRTLRPALDHIGMEKRAGEDETVSILRPQLIEWLGERGHDPDVQKWGEEAARRYMNDASSVDAAVAGPALVLAAEHGDRVLFDEFKRRFETAVVPADRPRYLAALGNFADPALEDSALAYVWIGPLRPNELFLISASMAQRSESSAEKTFAWTLSQWDQIKLRIPPTFLSFFTAIGSGCSAERLAKTQAFFKEQAIPGSEERLERVAEQVHDCIGLREREGATVASYLRGGMSKN